MNRKTGIGVIGLGGRGTGFLNLLARDHSDATELVGVADPNDVRIQAALRRTGSDCPGFTDDGDLLGRDGLDAVIITSPDYLHEQHAVAALKAGVHVFIDKPLATTVEGCLNIVRAARRSHRLLYMGFNMRFDPVVQRMKQIVDEGTAGRVFQIECQEFYDGGRTYMARWNRLKKFSGGLWVHKGTHDFDIINWLMGARPKQVSAFAHISALKPDGLPFELKKGERYGPRCAVCPQAKRCPDKVTAPPDTFGEEAVAVDGYARDLCIFKSDKDTHDHGVSIVQYDGGQTAVHTECFVSSLSNRLYTVTGDRATIKADKRGNTVTVYPRWSRDVVTYELTRGEGGHGGADPVMLCNFLDCVRGRAEPLADVIDGVWSVAIGEAAEHSVEEKRVVEIDELLNPRSRLLTPRR